MKLLLAILGILIGAFAMIFGEFDNSPGLQGLGMLLIIFISYKLYRSHKERTRT